MNIKLFDTQRLLRKKLNDLKTRIYLSQYDTALNSDDLPIPQKIILNDQLLNLLFSSLWSVMTCSCLILRRL